MEDMTTEASPLGEWLAELPGVVGATLGTPSGELHAVVGRVGDGDGSAATAAVIVTELAKLGALLGLGELGVTSVKSAGASRCFARRGTAVVAIELDVKTPVGNVEAKLRGAAWPQSQAALLAPLPPPSESPAARHTPSRSARFAATISGLASSASGGAPTRPPLVTMPMNRGPAPPGSDANRLPPSVPVPSRAVGTGQVFAGDLEELSLPDLLEFLRNSQRTGLLLCTASAGSGAIQLSRGMIISAVSPHSLDLRQHLLASPALGPAQRDALASLPAERFDEAALIDALVSRELVPRDTVERARVDQIYSAFREMLSWTVGRFSFDPATAVPGHAGFALSAQTILMRIYQEQDGQDG
jgi:hypothetical protein